ncbi:MAG: Xaa-Pro peptidase family protein [Candidatus Bathyarchaeia archaeon]|jgi:Xaa-Pro aminopeptidase
MDRVDVLRELAFEEKGFGAFLVGNEKNLLYLTGTPGAFCLLIPRKGESTVYAYGVNYEQTKAEARGFKVELLKAGEKLTERLAPMLKAFKIEKLAIDTLSYDYYRLLAKGLRGRARLKVEGGLIWKLRKVKDEKELPLMRKAGKITSVGMQAAYKTIKPGVTEIEVAAEIEYAMRKEGGWGTGFDTIVASGIRSAYPHGGCANRKIGKGDLVVVDIGAIYEHYCSDMTRTMVAGKPSEKQERMYETVKTAQEKAYQAIKAKAKAKDIDQIARKTIQDAGYVPYDHGLGHGVGLEIHEPPTLSATSKDRLVAGNVVTNEPGIYIPNLGGIRIEDTVLVQEEKAEKLTKGPYTLEAEK